MQLHFIVERHTSQPMCYVERCIPCQVYRTLSAVYKGMVGPHLEYANSVWYPYNKSDIEIIEKVQKKLYEVHNILKEIIIY